MEKVTRGAISPLSGRSFRISRALSALFQYFQ